MKVTPFLFLISVTVATSNIKSTISVIMGWTMYSNKVWLKHEYGLKTAETLTYGRSQDNG